MTTEDDERSDKWHASILRITSNFKKLSNRLKALQIVLKIYDNLDQNLGFFYLLVFLK